MTRSHPVRAVLGHAAMGQAPSGRDLDRLALPNEQRRRLAEEARAIAALRRAGEHGQAPRRATEAAGTVIDALPAEMRADDYLEPNEDLSNLGPTELAGLVKTRW